jgi:uncharacterized protein YndB with AHSA1/START domain
MATAADTLTHSTFTVEREIRATRSQTFSAFSNPDVKAQWFGGPAGVWRRVSAAMDFREGGHEHSEGQFGDGGPRTRFDATYCEILPDERIVYAYEMRIDGVRLSVSLATIELFSTDAGTRIVITEQGAFYRHQHYDAPREPGADQDDATQRKQGTESLLGAIARVLED